MTTPTSRCTILAEAVAALQEMAGRLSTEADEEMRRDLEEEAQVWHEAADVVRRLIDKPRQPEPIAAFRCECRGEQGCTCPYPIEIEEEQ
ncbi:hypothetical protein ACIPXV_09350 [Streptomyces libani]|uniref:hypothetical protein n=1 Tax=Streptomyces nigrescens TaxID=1920 RepID=UPI003823DE0C